MTIKYEKTCVKFDLKKCIYCVASTFNKSMHSDYCLVDLYKKDIMECKNKNEIKKHLINRITNLSGNKNYMHHIDYVKAGAHMVSPEYSSFIDKILLLL